jgi:hypothetical protein
MRIGADNPILLTIEIQRFCIFFIVPLSQKGRFQADEGYPS